MTETSRRAAPTGEPPRADRAGALGTGAFGHPAPAAPAPVSRAPEPQGGGAPSAAAAPGPDPDVTALQRLADLCFPPGADGTHAPHGTARTVPGLDRWREETAALHRLVPGPRLERALDDAESGFRALWTAHAHGFTDHLLKSPPLGTPVRLPAGRPSRHSYERNIECHALEDRLTAQDTRLRAHEGAHVVYSSGMAAIAGVVQGYQGLTRPTADRPLRLTMWGAYYETAVLLDLIGDDCLRWSRAATQEELCATVTRGGADVLLLEPVRYDWELEALDLPALLRAWTERRGGRPGLVVVDSTLVSPAWPMERLVEEIGAPGVLLAEVRSGLKLDQRGLELGNLGVVSLYARRDDPSLPPARDLAAYLRKMRTVTGAGPALATLSLLSAPFVLDRASARDHARGVFRNNALAARLLDDQERGLFARIAHPSLSDHRALPWAQAPFVVCHLREDRLDHHGVLLGVLRDEARRRGLPLVHGSSFGFRAHRFECVIPSLREGRGLFKVAMGSRAGWGRTAVLELLLEVAAHPDTAALRRAFPGAEPVDLTDLE